MPLDLVGKLHRTVYVEGCPTAMREDLVRMMMAKCGPIDGWDCTTDGGRLTIVFQTMNSVPTALSFANTSFGDLTTKLAVWLATQQPPAGVSSQLVIGDRDRAQEDLDEAQRRRAAREKRLAAIQEWIKGEGAAAVDEEGWIRSLCYRQLKALTVLTKSEIDALKAEAEHLDSQCAMTENVLAYLTKGASEEESYGSPAKRQRC